MTPLHHMHAQLAGGGKRGSVSFDIGDMRWRCDGGTEEQKQEAVKRLAFCWNMNEGRPTASLEMGVEREFFDAVQALVDALNAPSLDFALIAALTVAVSASWEKAVVVELTADGRRAECPCSEVVR